MNGISRLVARTDIVDYATYEDTRDQTRPHALAAKKTRRVHLNEHLTFLFENRDTLRYQIQEITRVERIVRERDIVHEIDTYNAILGDPGDLGCVLLIEIEDPDYRRQALTDWLALPSSIYVRLGDGSKVYAQFDATQVGKDRLSAVQYLRFAVDGRPPAAIGTDLNLLECEVELTDEQIVALTEDLAHQ